MKLNINNNQNQQPMQQQTNMQYQDNMPYNYNQQSYNQSYNYNQTNYNQPPIQENNQEGGNAILGILSIIFGFLVPVIGFILGIIGIITSKTNPKNKKLSIIGTIISIVCTIIYTIIIFLIFNTALTSDSNTIYGNTSAEKVITRYWEAIDKNNKEQAKKCFPSELDVNLTGEIWENNIYEWDIDNLTIEKEEKLIASDYEDIYGISPITSVYAYKSSCHYLYDSDPGVEGDMAAEFIVCEYAKRYYILKVTDIDTNYNPTIEEEGETGYFPLGDGDIGKIDINSPTVDINGSTFTEDSDKENELKEPFADARAYIQLNPDENNNQSAVYLIKYTDTPIKSKFTENAYIIADYFTGYTNLYKAEDLMEFKNAYYACKVDTSEDGQTLINTDVYIIQGNDNITRALVLVYPVYDEITAGLWKEYTLDCGIKEFDNLEDTSFDEKDGEYFTEETTTETTESTTENTTETESNNLSIDLSSRQFTFDGVTYTLPFKYSEISDKYTFDLADYGKGDTYLLNPGDSTASTIHLENPDIDKDFDFSVGFENYSDEALDIKETSIHSFDMDKKWCKTDNYPTIVFPNGITWGSTVEDIKNAYGEPTEEPYYAESLNYWEYNYEFNKGEYRVRFTIYDDLGLTGVSVKYYGK